MRRMGRGAFLLFEGVDRSGKSTQSKKLVDALTQKGVKVAHMRFPDETTSIGKMMRSYLQNKAEFDARAAHLMFSANRWETADAISDLLATGTTIVCDRYAYSGVAFSAVKGLPLEWCKSPDRGLPAPDVVIYLTLSIEESAKRGGFGQERYEKLDYQTRVKAVYENDLKDDSWTIVDAHQSIDAISADILAIADAAIADVATKPIGSMFSDLPYTTVNDETAKKE